MTDNPASEDALLALQEKVDALSEKISKHIEEESGTLAVIQNKLDLHLEDHQKSTERWKQAVVGFIFATIGAVVLAVGNWLWDVLTKGK